MKHTIVASRFSWPLSDYRFEKKWKRIVIDANIIGGNMIEDWAAVLFHLTCGPLSYSEILWRVTFQ